MCFRSPDRPYLFGADPKTYYPIFAFFVNFSPSSSEFGDFFSSPGRIRRLPELLYCDLQNNIPSPRTLYIIHIVQSGDQPVFPAKSISGVPFDCKHGVVHFVRQFEQMFSSCRNKVFEFLFKLHDFKECMAQIPPSTVEAIETGSSWVCC